MAIVQTIQDLLPRRKESGATSDVAHERWLQALGLLFIACEPLTHDCIRSKEEAEDLLSGIERHTFYCLHVKLAIEDGVEPVTWERWSGLEKKFTVTAEVVDNEYQEKSLDPLEMQEFSDDLTNMFIPSGVRPIE